MTMFTVGAKAASALGVAAIAFEAHDIAKRNSRKSMAQASADKFVNDQINASKLNSDSARHGAIKKFLQNLDISDKFLEVGGAVGGYLSGIGKCLKNNIFTVGFGALGLLAKSRPIQAIALAGMGISILFDTIINATGIFEKSDYLDK